MDFSISFLTHSAVKFGPGWPQEFSKLILPTGEASYGEGGFGKLLFQEIKTGRFSVLQQTYRLKEKLSLLYKRNVSLLQIIIAQKGTVSITISDIGEIVLRENQFIIVYEPEIEDIYLFEKPEDAVVTVTYFPLEVLQQFASLFPLLHRFLETIHDGKATLLFKQPGWSNLQVDEIIESIFHFSGDDTMRRLHFDKKIKELLFMLLLQEYTNAAVERRIVRKNMEAVYEAKSFIENNTNRPITIRKLAQQVGLNETKLKTSFKLVFAISLSDFMLTIRMKKAWRSIMETDKPVKEIARLTGYATTQNFLTAFRKYFHCTPGSLRKKDNQ